MIQIEAAARHRLGTPHVTQAITPPVEIGLCQSCGACCAYSREWPRFTTESESDLERIPPALVDDSLGRMRCNGDRCAALGVARVLDPSTATSADIGAAIREVVANPAFTAAAMAQRDALAALPGPAAAVAAIAALATGQSG